MCGRLLKAMYGTRKAAQNWQREFTRVLKEAGFEQGKYSPCLFWHPQRELYTFVHGDNFVTSGEQKQLRWLDEVLKGKIQHNF